ncbi:MAG: DUF1289 domain-containing protein [Thiohalocapsa sp.]|jgi:predicted Fe-S protein YdhL (DUF1289 family)|nr:DUF1289 domain-containing protein [Thiohalocapsa sp.]MCF7989306.1 DUF1289 domain-containing protein [Thiohalocapsa sp.]
MTVFKPCAGKDACTDGGSHCQGCGRSHEEIARTRDAIAILAELAVEMDYTNVEAFADYVARRIVKKTDQQRRTAAALRPVASSR